jgi:hypothetical protein
MHVVVPTVTQAMALFKAWLFTFSNKTWTARDACGNTSTASRTVTWTFDVTPPTITTGGCSLTLGCNPSAGDINGLWVTATVSDNCSEIVEDLCQDHA